MEQEFVFNSIEVFAVLMTALQPQGVSAPTLPKPLAKRARRALAGALLAGPGSERQAFLEEVGAAYETLYSSQVKPMSAAAAEVDLAAHRAAKRADMQQNALAWVQAVHKQPTWRSLAPVLERVLAADPQTPVHVERDGAAAEAWANSRLRAAAHGTGWRVYSSATRTDVMNEKGLKGEADALLLDPQAICRGIVEMKIGSARPYNALYSDIRKLKRLIKSIDDTPARTATFDVPPLPSSEMGVAAAMPAAGRDGVLTSSSSLPSPRSVDVRFAKHVAPVYLLVMDEDVSLAGEEVLRQAEDAVLKIGVSMALACTKHWLAGDTKLLSVDSERAHVQAAGFIINGMRRKMASDFFEVLAGCELYQVLRPQGATW